VAGDLPAHGSYTKLADRVYEARPDLASPDQVVTQERVEGWLAEGADITQELSNAVIANDIERVKFLVSKGADVNKVDSQGWTPLTSAARQRHDKMAALLIDLGADVNESNDGMTPLVAAVMRDHVPTIKVLVEKGADINEAGPQGFSPLAIAITDNRYEAAKALMNSDADFNSPSGAEGLTPLMLVAAQTSAAEGARFVPGSTRPIDIAKSLIEKGADVNAKAKNGMTALMIAATHNSPSMIGLLMGSGADAGAKNNLGQTATDVAEINGNLEAAQAILVLANARPEGSPSVPGAPDPAPTTSN
jgi:ankyrin repeat protein